MKFLLKCLSHSPLQGFNDPSLEIVTEVKQQQAKVKKEVEDFNPDLIIIFAPDHYNGLFYDLMPQFVIAAQAISIGDYSSRAGHLKVDTKTAIELHKYLLEQDIDMAISHRLQVDHGCAQTLEEITGSLTTYPVLPIIINSVAPPFCSYKRIRKMGELVGKFAATLNKKILIVGSGGLSHEPPVPLLKEASTDIAEFLIAGRNPTPEARAQRQANTIATGKIYGSKDCSLTPINAEWDQKFIDTLIQQNFAAIEAYKVQEVSDIAGRSTQEIRTWIAAFAALDAQGEYIAQQKYYRPIPEWIAGYGILSAKPKHN